MTFARAIAAERPDQVALRDDNRAYTWEQVDDILNRTTNELLALDLGPDRRMAVFAENAAETASCLVG